MPGRTFNPDEYRYGYNKGSEKDDEISPGVYSTFYRELDTRLGRWWSIDPEADEMPWQSPYSSMDNTPIMLNDPKGDCPTCPVIAYETAVGLYEAYVSLNELETMLSTTTVAKISEAEMQMDIEKNPMAHAIGNLDYENAEYFTQDDPQMWSAWRLHTSKGITMTKALDIVQTEERKIAALRMSAKKGPKDLVGEAKAKKDAETAAAARAAKREAATQQGKTKTGNSNQEVKGDHTSTKKGAGKAKKSDHQNAVAKRQAQQKRAKENKGKWK